MKLFRELTQRLSIVYPTGEAKALARWVMEEHFGLSMTDLMMDKDNNLSSHQLQDLENITERLLHKEPIQYILGHTLFCGLDIEVRPGVLIPRPETAELVEWICQDYEAECRPDTRVLDMGTGSGCIALSLAHRGFHTEACDISTDALDIAESNAKRLGLNIRFFQKDILQDDAESDQGFVQYDAIVSNPPYICQHEAAEMEANVLEHEPHLALFVPDDDPLLFYRHIAQFAKSHLTSNGRLYFEINRSYGQEIREMLSNMGFCNITLQDDQYGNTRMVRATTTSPNN